MPLNRPSLAAIRDRVAADIDRHAKGSPYQSGTLEFSLANALAGISHELHGAIQYNADQLFDDSADDASIARRAAPYGVTRIAAVAASDDITITGNSGVVIAAGTQLQSPDGQIYTTGAEVTTNGGSAKVSVTAKKPGTAGNQSAGTKLTFNTPIAGIDSEATVATGLSNGSDLESLERFKQRFAERKQTPPKGGADDDYVAWAKQGHVDVTRVWVHQSKNPQGNTEYGSVLLYLVTDELATVIPTQAVLNAVDAYIDLPRIRPAGVKNVYVEAPTGKALNITFNSLSPNTVAVQKGIEAELKDLLKREAVPGGAILLSRIREAISKAAGEQDYAINLTADFTTATGEIATLGALTWPGA